MKSHHGSYYYYTGEDDPKEKSKKKKNGNPFDGQQVQDQIEKIESETDEEKEISETEKS
jgi:hypothetical protein